MKRFHQTFTLLLPLVDYAMILASFVLAYQLREEIPVPEIIYLQPLGEYFRFAMQWALLWIFAFFAIGLYRFQGFSRMGDLFARIVAGCAIALGLFVVGLFLTQIDFFSRLIVVYLLPITVLLVLSGRGLLGFAKQWFQYYGVGQERVLVVGGGATTAALEAYFASMHPAYWVVATFPQFDMQRISAQSQIDRIVLSEELPGEQMLELIRWCEDRAICLQYLASPTSLYAARFRLDTLAGYPAIELSPTPLAGWGRIAKRLFDFFGALVGIVLLSPIMLVVAIAIKLDSKGPIIFAQERVGELGKLFTFYKFRGMYTEYSTGKNYGGDQAEALLAKLRAESNEADGPMFKMAQDPRITKVGRVIRKTSLDELPQLFNVFLGNMSLVGPRPALPEEVAQYDDAARRRLMIKPGITGMWQVSGRNDVSFDEYVKLDTYYIENWSVWLDIKIILLTIRAIFARTGK